MSVRLYVGNLPKEAIDKEELHKHVCDQLGEDVETKLVTTKLIKDRKTKKCRGFAFVTVSNDEQATLLIEKLNGTPFMDSSLKIEKAEPRTKGKQEKEKDNDNKERDESKATPKPVKAGSGGGNASGGGRNKNPKRSKGRGNAGGGPGPDSVQPDPRWADELMKLKEMLAAQTTNS